MRSCKRRQSSAFMRHSLPTANITQQVDLLDDRRSVSERGISERGKSADHGYCRSARTRDDDSRGSGDPLPGPQAQAACKLQLGSWNLELCAHSGGDCTLGRILDEGADTQGDADISLSGSLWISQRSPEDLRDISRTCWLVHIVPEALVYSVLRWLH